MKKILIAAMIAVAPLSVQAQQANDLAKVWLSQHAIAATDYRTCDPAPSDSQVVGTDGICAWGADLGTQPTPAQLQSLAPVWQTMQQAGRFQSILAAGVTIADPNGHCPPCVGTWAIDDTAELHIDSQMSAIKSVGTFTNGLTSRSWVNLAGTAAPSFAIGQFTTLGQTIGAYKDAIIQARILFASGQAASWPSSTVSLP